MESRKKILYIINSLGAGGAEKLTVQMANYFNKDYEVTVVCLSKNEFFKTLLNKDIKYITLNNFNGISKLAKLFFYIKNNDVIHCHLFPGLYIGALFSLFLKRNFIFTEHNISNRRRKPIFRFLEKIIYNQYNTITVISQGVEQSLIDWIGPTDQIKLVPNFIDFNQIENAVPLERSLFHLSEDDHVLVMVGSFHNDQKDQKTLIDTVKLLDTNYKLLLIGDGKLKHELQEYVKSIGLEDRVLFLGRRHDVYNILKICDIGVLSSRYEGFGIVVLEYMAAGIISLGSNVDGLNEVIGDKRLLFKVGDVIQLNNLILSFQDVGVYDEYRKLQFIHMQQYRMERVLEMYNHIYN